MRRVEDFAVQVERDSLDRSGPRIDADDDLLHDDSFVFNGDVNTVHQFSRHAQMFS